MSIRLVRPFAVVSIVVALTSLRPAVAAAQEVPAPSTEVPPNIAVSATLRPVVALLLQKSQTFRRQCGRIAAARYARIIVIATPPLREQSAPRARASIGRHLHGALRAVIEIPVTADVTELLPHEFEHVIEQLEGIDLAGLARAGQAGVVEVDDGMFETARARTAGLTVAREVYGDTDQMIAGATRGVTRALRILRARVVAAATLRTALPGR